MVIIHKIGKVARKVNAVALAGAITIGSMGLMSFVGDKEEATGTEMVGQANVTYGVIETDGDMLYITDDPVSPGTSNCQLSEGDCKATFPAAEESTIVQEDANGNRYVDINDVSTEGIGPFAD